jgi:hypothetical protein
MEAMQTAIKNRDQDRVGSPRCCLHVKTGRSPEAKACILNYECRHCGFDQWLEALEKMHAQAAARQPESA